MNSHQHWAILSTVFWGASFTLIPFALESFTPFDLLAARFGIAAAVYGLLLATGVIKAVSIPSDHWPRFVVITILTVVVYNLSLNVAQQNLPAGLAILVVQSAPILILVSERFTTGQFQVRRPWLSVATWVVGTLFVAIHYGVGTIAGSPLSFAVLCLTPVALAGYNTLAGPLLERFGAANVCAQVFIVGGSILFLLRCGSSTFWVQVSSATPTSLCALAALVLLTTVVAYTLWFWQVAERGASEMAVYLNLVPVFGLVFSVTLLREPASPWLAVGGALVVLGSVSCGNKSRAHVHVVAESDCRRDSCNQSPDNQAADIRCVQSRPSDRRW